MTLVKAAEWDRDDGYTVTVFDEETATWIDARVDREVGNQAGAALERHHEVLRRTRNTPFSEHCKPLEMDLDLGSYRVVRIHRYVDTGDE